MLVLLGIIIALFLIARAVGRQGPSRKYARYFRARSCPNCFNKIPGEASICEFCGSSVVPTWNRIRRDQ